MVVKELLKQIADAVAEDPEVMNATVLQQSCMDSPYAYTTLRTYVGDEYFDVGDDLFVNGDDAEHHAEQYDSEVDNITTPIFVLEAI